MNFESSDYSFDWEKSLLTLVTDSGTSFVRERGKEEISFPLMCIGFFAMQNLEGGSGVTQQGFVHRTPAVFVGAVIATLWLGLIPQLDGQRSLFAYAVVINEINYHPTTDLENEEFIEIWNYGATTVTLSSWAFTRGVTFTFTTGTTLGPNGYLVVAKDPTTLAPLAPGARILGPWLGGLQNNGERIRLVDHLGQTVDEVRYDHEPPWPTTPDGRGASLERICPTALGDDPANWTAATGAPANDWVLITQTGVATSSRLYIYLGGAGEALVDDVRITTEGFTGNLVNNPDFEQPFAGDWSVTGNHAASFREPTGQAHSGSYVCHIVATGTGGGASNSLNQYTQTLRQDGTIYNLSFWAKYVSGNGTITARLQNSGLFVTQSLVQTAVTMTPGAANTAYRANLPPFAEYVSHTPECPKPGNPVTVSGRIRDTDGVTSATLLYQTLTSTAQSGVFSVPMALTSGTAQAGVWSALIPAQADRTLVRYRIRAADTVGGARNSPDPTDARDTYSYFQYADDVVCSIPVAFMYELGPQVPEDSLRGNIALIVRPPGPTSRWEVYDHIIRTDRGGGHNIYFLNHFLYDGMSSINVVWETTYTPLRARYQLSEYMSYEMHRALGSLSGKVGHFRFSRNDTPLGYYLMFEQPNRTFLGRSGLDNDGNIYKITWNAPPEKKTNLSLGNADIVEFQNSLGSLTGTALTNYIFQNMDVEQFVKYYVGNTLTSDWDGYFNNHFLYHDIEDTHLWSIMPWDRDKTWGDNDAYAGHPTPGGVAGLCYLYPIYDQPILFGANGTPRSGTDSNTWWRQPGWESGPFLANAAVQCRFLKRLEDAALHVFTTERWYPVLDALQARLEPEAAYRATLRGENPADRLTELHNDILTFRNHLIYRRSFILNAVNPRTYPNVIAITPAPFSALTEPPTEIRVSFTEPISTATVNATTFRLVRSGGDGSFGEANDVTIIPSSTPALMSPEQARMELNGVSLPPDRYRITLVGDGASPIRDTVGNALDGETTGSLPSGNCAPGGDFISDFILAIPEETASHSSWKLYR